MPTVAGNPYQVHIWEDKAWNCGEISWELQIIKVNWSLLVRKRVGRCANPVSPRWPRRSCAVTIGAVHWVWEYQTSFRKHSDPIQGHPDSPPSISREQLHRSLLPSHLPPVLHSRFKLTKSWFYPKLVLWSTFISLSSALCARLICQVQRLWHSEGFKIYTRWELNLSMKHTKDLPRWQIRILVNCAQASVVLSTCTLKLGTDCRLKQSSY